MAPFDVTQTDALLSTTRAVRRRLDFDRPVEPELILQCLEVAVQAPIASNREILRWVVVTAQPLKDRLAQIYREEGLEYLEDMRGAAVDSNDRRQERVAESALFLAHNLERVPVLVIPCIAEAVDLSSNPAAAAMYASIIPATWSFQLALRSRGLGSAWTTLHLGQAEEVADLLGIPREATQIALLPVAYTRGVEFAPARRSPIRQVTYWDRWGSVA